MTSRPIALILALVLVAPLDARETWAASPARGVTLAPRFEAYRIC